MTLSKHYARLRKIGNGRGILLSKSICNLIGMDIDDNFILDIVDEKIVLIPIKEGKKHAF